MKVLKWNKAHRWTTVSVLLLLALAQAGASTEIDPSPTATPPVTQATPVGEARSSHRAGKDTYLEAYQDSHGDQSLGASGGEGYPVKQEEPSPSPAPSYAAAAPQHNYGSPQQTYGVPSAPQQNYGQPQQNYPAPQQQQNYPAPQQNYGPPATSYGVPASPVYSAPATAPAPTYGASAPTYGAPAPSYGPPQGPPAPVYGPPPTSKAVYGPPAAASQRPQYQYGPPGLPIYAPIPFFEGLVAGVGSIVMQFGSLLSSLPLPDFHTALKILLKVIIFKGVVKIASILLLMLFLPKLEDIMTMASSLLEMEMDAEKDKDKDKDKDKPSMMAPEQEDTTQGGEAPASRALRSRAMEARLNALAARVEEGIARVSKSISSSPEASSVLTRFAKSLWHVVNGEAGAAEAGTSTPPKKTKKKASERDLLRKEMR